MPIYVEKNMRYAHSAEICINMRNMGQSHICVKLTCLTMLQHCEMRPISTEAVWSACLFVYWSQPSAIQKWLNQSRCCLGYRLG